MTNDEFKTGVLADGTRLMQPPADFIADAKRTLSPAWHGNKVDMAEFKGRINGAIDALNKLDQVKKSLFYGRDNNLTSLGRRNCLTLINDSVPDVRLTNIIHAIIGKATEAGELLEALRDHYNGKPLDRINVIEEIGDGFWYDAILLAEMASNFEEAQERNIAKLRARFPEKFEAEQANVRDLATERAILEQRGGTEGDEAPRNLGKVEVAVDGMGGVRYVEPILDLDAAVLSDPLRHLEPTDPASGSKAVLAVEAKANAAFAAVKAPRHLTIDDLATVANPELAKPINERIGLMPSEILARQPIRKSDVDKK